MLDCLFKTYKYEGFRGYYKGMLPNLLKVVPAVSIYYATYEYFKTILNQYNINEVKNKASKKD